MSPRPSPLLCALVAVSLTAACTVPPPAQGTPDAGVPQATNPIDAPPRTWTYVPLPESRCANGTSTGVAVNLEPDAKELVVFLQGGGACWESFACLYGLDGKGTATHLKDTVGESVVLSEAQQPSFFFDRDAADNPFRAAHFVYVPYCTGDLHAGNRVKGYQDLFNQTVFVHHMGAHNMDLLLERLKGAFPALERIWLTGVSAGGYGATLNWWRARAAFPGVRVDVLDDSGPPLDTYGGQYGTMRAAWDMRLPPDCEGCATHLSALLPYYAASVPAPHRYALLAWREDEVIRLYFGYAADAGAYRARVDALVDGLGERQRAFRMDGTAHVMLDKNPLPATKDGVKLLDWLRDFTSDAPGWSHAGP